MSERKNGETSHEKDWNMHFCPMKYRESRTN